MKITKSDILDVGACEIPEIYKGMYEKGLVLNEQNIRKFIKITVKRLKKECEVASFDSIVHILRENLDWILLAVYPDLDPGCIPGIPNVSSEAEANKAFWKIHEQLKDEQNPMFINYDKIESSSACDVPAWFNDMFPDGINITKKILKELSNELDDAEFRDALVFGAEIIKDIYAANDLDNIFDTEDLTSNQMISKFWEAIK